MAPASDSSSTPQWQPSQADIDAQARQQRRSAALDANNQALALQQSEDWAGAVASFEEAARLSPDDEVIQYNLTNARAQLRAQNEVRQSNQAASRNIQQYAQTLARGSQRGEFQPAIGSGGSLDFMSAPPAPSAPSRWGPQGECSELLAQNTETLRWAKQQAHDQGWGFFRDSAGITDAVAGAKQGAIDATVRKLGADDLKKVFDATRERLEQAREFKAFMARVEGCLKQATGAKTGCLIALAAEKGEEPAKEWLKGLLDSRTRDAAERAEKAATIDQQYVQRLEAAFEKQALSAAGCEY